MSRKKHDRIIHFEAAIQRMRFDKLSRVYAYLNDITMHAECYGGSISMDQMFKHYNDLKLPEIAYDYNTANDWGLSLNNLQHVGVYRAPKSTKLIQTTDKWQMDVEFLKGDGYYLVIRGVEKMEDIKDE